MTEADRRRDFLTQRAVRFFKRYGAELDSLRRLLDVRLNQLGLAYTLNNRLPRESVQIRSRIKTLESFIEKLARKGWPDYYYATDIARDLVGARVICWFQDDCYGILDRMKASHQIALRPGSEEDYIVSPKPSGYRSIHLLADLEYDRVVKNATGEREIAAGTFVCEIQLRTKLQDAWGEFTHEMHYKIDLPVQRDFEVLVSESAHRLASEDRQAIAIRNLLQSLKGVDEKHEGLREDGLTTADPPIEDS